MIKIENVEVVGWEHAIRGMRNPLNSWDKSDSIFMTSTGSYYKIDGERVVWNDEMYRDDTIGDNDLGLMDKLAKGGPVHAKYRRMIVVYLDIVAPLYWWKEFDTYKVGTVANSCSTMHKIGEKKFERSDFSCDHLMGVKGLWDVEFDDEYEESNGQLWWSGSLLNHTINILNFYREKWLHAKTKPMKEEAKRNDLVKKYWWQMIQLLPSSYNQRRTIMLSYEVLANIYRWRKDHKLDEWVEFCKWIETLPYSEIITRKATEPRIPKSVPVKKDWSCLTKEILNKASAFPMDDLDDLIPEHMRDYANRARENGELVDVWLDEENKDEPQVTCYEPEPKKDLVLQDWPIYDNIPPNYGDYIRKFRMKAGINQPDFSKLIRVHVSNFSNLEHGTKSVGADVWGRIVNAMKLLIEAEKNGELHKYQSKDMRYIDSTVTCDGESIVNRRKILGVSQKELAKKIGIRSSYMCKLEKGYLPVTPPMYKKIEAAFAEFEKEKKND